jgi:hypothetical protein
MNSAVAIFVWDAMRDRFLSLSGLTQYPPISPPAPQIWGELDLVPPKVGGLGGRVRKS